MQLVKDKPITFLNLHEMTTSDCLSLWQAVVKQAVIDVELLLSQAEYQQSKLGFVGIDKHEELMEIIQDVNDDYFQTCCDNAELEVSRVRNYVQELVLASKWHTYSFGTPVEFSLKTGKCLKIA